MPTKRSKNTSRARKPKLTNRQKQIAIQRKIYYSHRRWVSTKTWNYEDDVYEEVFPTQTCLFCYNPYMYDFNQRFFIRKRFCGPCREEIPFKQWCLVNRLFKLLETTLNKESAPPVENGSVLQFANNLYQCMRFKKSREVLVEVMNNTIALSNLGSPLELAEYLEAYDDLVHPKSKKREIRRKRRLHSR